MPLGIDGFRYRDLHSPERLRDLFDAAFAGQSVLLTSPARSYRASQGQGGIGK